MDRQGVLLLLGQTQEGPRKEFYYFNDDGQMVAMRYERWKVVFLENRGVGFGVWREPFVALRVPKLFDLRMDPYERGMKEGGEAMKFFGQQMWLLVPIQGKIKDFFADFDQYPYQTGSSLNASGIGYGMLRQQDAMKRLKDLEGMRPR